MRNCCCWTRAFYSSRQEQRGFLFFFLSFSNLPWIFFNENSLNWNILFASTKTECTCCCCCCFYVIVANNRVGFSSGRLAVGKGLIRTNALTSKQQLPDKWLSSKLQIESGADTSTFLRSLFTFMLPETRIRLKIQKLFSEKLNENLTMSLLLAISD